MRVEKRQSLKMRDLFNEKKFPRIIKKISISEEHINISFSHEGSNYGKLLKIYIMLRAILHEQLEISFR
jgi:hypothetical protein